MWTKDAFGLVSERRVIAAEFWKLPLLWPLDVSICKLDYSIKLLFICACGVSKLTLTAAASCQRAPMYAMLCNVFGLPFFVFLRIGRVAVVGPD